MCETCRPTLDEHQPIVVGADGSPGSRAALRWALAEATARDCGVSVWSICRPERDESTEHTQARAWRLVHETMDDEVVGRPDLPMCLPHAVVGDLVTTLAEVSKDFDLLVLGSHGVTGLIHSAMGSVAEGCIEAADCPVVVVPTTRDVESSLQSALVRTPV